MADAEAASERADHGAALSGAEPRQETKKLSDLQRERIQRNKERAKSIRQARMQSNPYDVFNNRPQHTSTGKSGN